MICDSVTKVMDSSMDSIDGSNYFSNGISNPNI